MTSLPLRETTVTFILPDLGMRPTQRGQTRRRTLADHKQRRRLICAIYADGSRLDPRALAGFNENRGRKWRTSIPPRRLTDHRDRWIEDFVFIRRSFIFCDRMRLSSIG
ncbi:hypothetical protein BHE74_00030819 [Ensete ventricosum]|nr:hypothetical protein BHE74_00030819 [Ensete ventricosum]